MAQYSGRVRFWFSGKGNLAEFPDLKLEKATAEAPRGAESYYDLELANLGCLNDQTVDRMQQLATVERYQQASHKFMTAHNIYFEWKSKRYVKGDLVLVLLDRWAVIWGYDPIRLLAEADKLEKGIGDGWVADEVIIEGQLPEGSGVNAARLVTSIFVLKEKPVVDLRAMVDQEARAKLYVIGAICGVTGFVAGALSVIAFLIA